MLKRNYRSRTFSMLAEDDPTALDPAAIMGFNWDMSYNIFLVNGTDSLIFHDGTGRSDTFTTEPGGSVYGRDEYFRTITKNPDDSFTMLHADGTRWEFAPMNNMGTTSKIAAIVDRNGNTMRFVYENVFDADGNSAQGLLTTIYDTLDHSTSASPGYSLGLWTPSGSAGTVGSTPLILVESPVLQRRAINFNYTNGLLTSVTDWTGRTVTYVYDANKDLGWVTTPAVIGTPNGNDFPGGKTTSYTYTSDGPGRTTYSDVQSFCRGYVWDCECYEQPHTKPGGSCLSEFIPIIPCDGGENSGFSTWWCGWCCGTLPGGQPDTVQVDVTYGQLLHNLLTITDAKGQGQGNPILQNNYASTLSPAHPLFDHIVSQVYGGDTFSFTYSQISPPDADGAVRKTIVNNRMGQVKELFYDNKNRLVKRVDLTGLANPTLPTGNNSNRPGENLRGGAPDPSTTLYEYDLATSRKTKIIHPNGNVETFEYDNDPSAPNPDPRFRGNLLSHTWDPGSLGGDQLSITESFTYETDFGGCCGFNFVKTHTDGRKSAGETSLDTVNDYDLFGNRIKTTHRDGGIEEWTYNSFGQVTTHTLPDNGNGHRRVDRHTYHPITVQQYGYLQRRIVDNGGLGLTTAYDYDDVGNVTKKTDPRSNATEYVVNALNQVVQETSRSDANGVRYVRDTFYDLNDNVVRVDIDNVNESGAADPNGTLTTTYDYDILNFMTRKTEEVDAGRNIVTEYGYNKNKKLIHIAYGEATGGDSDPATTGAQPFNTIDREYDERDLLFKETRAKLDADESTTQYDYDGNKNLTLIKQGIVNNTTTHVTTNIYDGYDRLVESHDALFNRTFYHYDANHNRVSSHVQGETGDTFGALWPGQPLSDITYTYDEMDRMTQSDVAQFQSLQLPSTVAITQVTYSQNSQILSVTDPGNDVTTVIYDTANRRSVITDPRGNGITYTYDENSNVTSVQEDDLHDIFRYFETFITTYAYDNLDRLRTTTDNVNNTSTYGYDSRNNRTLMTDALGNKTRYVYDGLNRLVTTIRDMDGNGATAGDAADIITTQAWDDSSRLIGRTDDNGNVTVYEYDPLGRMIAEVFADCTQTGYEYDVHHNATTITDANGSVIDCEYDLLDRLISKEVTTFGPGVSHDTAQETFAWDGLSRLVRAEDKYSHFVFRSKVAFQYDSLSNVINDYQAYRADPNDAHNWGETTATFDGESNMLSCTYPGGREIGCTYDVLDRKATITDNTGVGQNQSGLLIADYKYVGRYRVAWRDYGNNTRMDYAYDGLANSTNDFGVRQVVGTTHSGVGGIIDQRTFVWDRMYNKKQRKDIRAGGPMLTHDYDYDPTYRLTDTLVTDSATAVVRDTTYNLDGVHNRLSVTGTPGPATGIYAMNPTACTDLAMNQYTTTPLDARHYDANGNLTSILGNDAVGNALAISCLYDYRNRMVEYLDSETLQRHTYVYDALGRRIVKTVDADGASPDTTRYFYGGETHWQVCEEQIALSQSPWVATTATYVYGRYIDEVLQMQRCEATPPCSSSTPPVDYYYHTDDMYNVMAVTDASGAVVERYEYGDYGTPTFMDAAGNVLTQPDGTPLTSSAIANPYLFTGRRYDPESGWYNYRTRYLDPQSGKFTTRDVIGIWGDPWELGNGYTYVANSPFSWLDPFGAAKGFWNKLLEKIGGGVAVGPYDAYSAGAGSDAEFAHDFADEMKKKHGDKYGERTENAVRHAAWQARLTRKHGDKKANQIGNLHELGEEGTEDSETDQHNNVIGRGIGINADSDEDIKKAVEDALKDGRLITDLNDPRIKDRINKKGGCGDNSSGSDDSSGSDGSDS